MPMRKDSNTNQGFAFLEHPDNGQRQPVVIFQQAMATFLKVSHRNKPASCCTAEVLPGDSVQPLLLEDSQTSKMSEGFMVSLKRRFTGTISSQMRAVWCWNFSHAEAIYRPKSIFSG